MHVSQMLQDITAIWQVKIFVLSFVVHALCETGLTAELITAAFYKQVFGADNTPDQD